VVALAVVSSNRKGFLHVFNVPTLPGHCKASFPFFLRLFPVDLSGHCGYSIGMKTKTRGRPAGSGQGKSDYLEVRLGPAEKQGFKAAAELAGLGVSSWVRERLRQVARKELELAGQDVPFIQQRTAS
jgi:hypothetical protein